MKIRDDVAALLREGLSDRRIAKQLHTDHKTVAAARRALGLPRHLPGRNPALSLEEAFWARVERVEGGHLRWLGPVGNNEQPVVSYRGTRNSAYRVAFKIGNKREPKGHCQPGCEYPRCVAPEHSEDEELRTRTRAALHAVMGRQFRADACGRGHGAEHRRFTPDGLAYCGACAKARSGGRR
ncbi:hypothetical protein ACIGW3_26085 [Streptomyces sp. NPDC053499]|uniref:hypothetical protein n=1 Tax=Streptomyces sp. NPDC053499 TaxID=3365707 RepID=UPI0037D437F6